MKKYIFSALAIAAMMVSCNNASPKMDEQPAAGNGSGEGMKIAYVEVDSLMTQYDFAKDYSVTLQKKSINARNTLTQKGNALQAAVNTSITSSRRSTTTDSRAVSRLPAYRLPSSASSATSRSCRLVWRESSPTRLPSSTRPCATHCRTS